MRAYGGKTLAALALAVGLFAGLAGQALAVDSFTPNPVVVTLGPGQSTTINKTLHLDALPGAADILIAIDTTGSMGPAIAQAKAQATQLCTDVQAAIPGARFAVWDFRDIPDRPATNGILKSLNAFTSSCVAVQAAVNLMTAGGGGDLPEAYNPVFHEAYSDPVLGASRNPNAVQFLVVLGDAAPHNSPAAAVAPACGNTPPADPGMTSDTEIAGLNANEITLLMIHYQHAGTSTTLACYQQLASATGGTAVSGGSDLSGEIIAQIRAAAAQIDQVSLVVSGAGCQTPAGLNIAFNPPNPPPYGPFTAPVNIPFQETITAPTVAGSYSCTVTAVVDGAARATQVINATVTAGPPVTLTLDPPTDTNPAGVQHCVTATVRDAFGNPVSGVTVQFTVTGANAASGTATTDANGRATFCYTGTNAGLDTITAQAPATTARGVATKLYVPGPPATLVLTPPTATNTVDTQHCVTATVRDAFGNPVPGVTVQFTVTGANAASGTATTAANGRATFCYTGVNPGLDTITAQVPGTTARGVATKTWILPLVDHFKCYSAAPPGAGSDDEDEKDGDNNNSSSNNEDKRSSAQRIVTLEDQFGAGRASVKRAKLLCNPVDKNGEGISQREFHLVGYGIEPINRKFAKRRVEVRNQFGVQILKVGKPDTLLVPSSKSIAPAQPGPVPFMRGDHFQCYPVGGDDDSFKQKTVVLTDQFGRETVRVLRPIALCNPVEKNNEGALLSPSEHLTCYSIKAATSSSRTVFVRNQFGLETLKVRSAKSLCVPSTKRVLPARGDDGEDD
jgi:Mg-chelatase subunit ChlD